MILFDLDDTLYVDREAAAGAFAATAAEAARRDPGIAVEALAAAARVRARSLWQAGPGNALALAIGMSSWEGLWCRFVGEPGELGELRDWAAEYRRETWRGALADAGGDGSDVALAEYLGERFMAERRARHAVFDDAAPVLEVLGRTHDLALVTNGAPSLQREKLAASGLAAHFAAVVISGDLGVAKPDPAVFHHALGLLGAVGRAASAVMVGDNLIRDVHGARAAGLRALWLNRDGRDAPGGEPEPDPLHGLEELPARLAALDP